MLALIEVCLHNINGRFETRKTSVLDYDKAQVYGFENSWVTRVLGNMGTQ